MKTRKIGLKHVTLITAVTYFVVATDAYYNVEQRKLHQLVQKQFIKQLSQQVLTDKAG